MGEARTRSVVVRDAVWGDVELEPWLVDVLDTPEVQRLRGVRQLGTAHLVYPSANHTRFEHMLGACHVAGRILDALRGNGAAVDPEVARVARAAALIHDVGHVPFGHTFEDERRIFPRHDRPERTRRFLGDTDLGRALERHGLRAGVLAALGAGEHGPGDPGRRTASAADRVEVDPGPGVVSRAARAGAHPSDRLAADLVSGTIGADLLDYLARDAHFTGIRRAYDERVFRYFTVHDGRLVLCLQKRGLPREDALSEVVHLLRLRYTLTERVYFHHTKLASGALVSKLVERATGDGLTLEALFGLGDEGLLLHLARVHAPRDPVIARLLDDLRRRSLPKRAYLLGRRLAPGVQASLVARFHQDRAAREAFEAEVERACDLEPGDVIVHCPGPDMALKEADILVDAGRGGVRSLKELNLPEIDGLLERHRDLWRLHVLVAERRADARARVAAACEERLGVRSALTLGDE